MNRKRGHQPHQKRESRVQRQPVLGRACACAFLLAGVSATPAWAVSASLPAGTQASAIAQGPMIGGITAKSATVWVRTNGEASVRVRWLTPNGVNYTYTPPVLAKDDADDTAQVPIANLGNGKTYTYQVGVTGADGVETWSGSYKFATIPGTVGSVSFAVLSDFSNKLKSSPALRDALSHQPDFLAVIGDLDHRNPASSSKTGVYPQQDAPQVLADLRAMHRDTRDFGTPIGNDFASGLIGMPNSAKTQIPMYYGWDDHDFCTNNADATCPFAPEAVQAAREYYVYQADNGLDGGNGCATPSDFQRIDYGRLLSVFILDVRSARGGAHTTLLGDCQYNWLTQGLANSKATWKVVLTPVPFNPYMKTWDAWGHFPDERARFLAFLQQKGIHNLVFLSGDVHSGVAVDDGTHYNLPEIAVPHANMPDDWINTYCMTTKGHVAAQSEPGLWTIGTLTEPDFDSLPQAMCEGKTLGVGVQLIYPTQGVYATSGTGRPGYVRVDVTASGLTAQVIGADGITRIGQEASGMSKPMVLELSAN
jgi:alkaline phosphatase D